MCVAQLGRRVTGAAPERVPARGTVGGRANWRHLPPVQWIWMHTYYHRVDRSGNLGRPPVCMYVQYVYVVAATGPCSEGV